MKKRFLALFLALVMALALMPAPAFAAGTEPALTGAEMAALLPPERPEMTPPESLSLPFDEYGEEDEAATFREIAELTQSLTAGKTTETEKARAIFDWVSQNIEYDYTAYGYITAQYRGERLTEEQEIRASQAENPGCTFLNRRGVCGGYSALTLLMHGLAGLPTGYISCKLNNLPHQGNAVYADDRWILLDSTNKWWDMSLDQYPVTESITWWDGIFRMRIYSTGQVSCFVQNRYKDISDVTIPDSVNTLDDSAFANCTKLTSVIIPSNVIYLKNGVFKGCTALTSVDIPDSVTDMGTWTFWDCTALTSVTIPDSVTKIGQYTFNGCTALAHLDIPDSVTEIETDAFKNCTALTEVTIPGSMTKLAGHTFEGCTALTDVTFLDGLTDIKAGMFWGCSNLKRVAIPASVTGIGQAAFYNCPNVTDVYYGGREAQWDAIEIKMFNSPLARGSTTRATFHYNSTMPTQPTAPIIVSAGVNPEASGTAYTSTQSVLVDGTPRQFQYYALKDDKGGETNYVKLRDLADALDGTNAQFNVTWTVESGVGIETGAAYSMRTGQEGKTPYSGDRGYKKGADTTLVNGVPVPLQAFFLTDDQGGDHTYYKLRDLGQALGFNVGYSDSRGVFIETNKPYTDAD